MSTDFYPLPSLNNPQYVIPLGSEGFVINVNSGTYNMTGLTVTLILTLNTNPAPASPVVITLPCTVASDFVASYTTTGSEFATSGVGLYDAKLKITGSGILLYSQIAPKLILVQ